MTNYVFPEMWQIKITNENRQLVNDWKIKQKFNRPIGEYNYKVNYVDFSGWGGRVCCEALFISTEQFIQYVLKQPIEIQNYDYLIKLFERYGIK